MPPLDMPEEKKTLKTLKILQYPHPILRQVAKPVVDFNQTLKDYSEQMIAMLYQDNAVGLAANQVGLTSRFFVMDVSSDLKSPMVFINPEIISKEGEGISQEGCMSLPALYLEVDRATKVTVKYQDINGEKQVFVGEGLAAFCIQHEIEHLNGILSIDHFSKFKQTFYIKKMQKALRFEAKA